MKNILHCKEVLDIEIFKYVSFINILTESTRELKSSLLTRRRENRTFVKMRDSERSRCAGLYISIYNIEHVSFLSEASDYSSIICPKCAWLIVKKSTLGTHARISLEIYITPVRQEIFARPSSLNCQWLHEVSDVHLRQHTCHACKHM